MGQRKAQDEPGARGADLVLETGDAGFGRREIGAWLALAGTALALRSWAIAARLEHGSFSGMLDTRYYLDRLDEIAAGRWLPDRAFFMSPFYPYFLKLTGGVSPASFGSTVVVQSLIGVAAIAIMALAARRLAGRIAGLASLALGALAAPLVLYDTSLLPDGPALALLGAGSALLMLVERPRDAVLAGCLLALAVALRSNLLVAVVLLAAWGGWRGARRRGRQALAILAPTILVLLAISAANLAAEGLAAPVSYNSGLNLYLGNNPRAQGSYTMLDELGPDDPQGRAFAERTAGRALDSAALDRFWRQRALRFLGAHPGQGLALWARKSLLFWLPYEIPQMEDLDLARRESRALRLAFVSFGVALPLALIGACGLPAPRRARAAPLLLLVGAAMATCVVFFVNGRLRLPVWAGLLPLAGCGVAVSWDWLRGAARRPPVAVLSAVALAVLLHLVPVQRQWNRVHSAMRYAVIEALAGNSERARTWIAWGNRQARALPNDPLLSLERGAALYAVGDHERALEHLADAAQALPDSVRARQGLLAACRRVARDSHISQELRRACADARDRAPPTPRP